MQNGRARSFHGRFRKACLKVGRLGNLFEARGRIAAWRKECNEERAHSSLVYRTMEELAREIGGEKEGEKGAAWKGKDQFYTPIGNPEAPAAR